MAQGATTGGLSDLKPIYLIYGEEDLLLEQAVTRLKTRLESASEVDLQFNFDVFDGEKDSADAILGAANTLPFMSERRLVIARNADKLSTDDLNLIADYAANPNPETTLVLVAPKIAKNMRVYKAIHSAGGAAEYAAPKRGEYPRTVVGMFESRGRRIGIDAAEVLVRAVGTDLRRISVEIDKVIAFAGERTTLSAEDVEQVMSTTAETSIFDFVDAIGYRDTKGALRLLASLMADGESIFGVHAMAVRHVRMLVQVRALEDRPDERLSPDAIAKAVGSPPWLGRKLVQQADRFTASELTGAIRAAAESEAKMKTSRDARLVFERWLVSVCD